MTKIGVFGGTQGYLKGYPKGGPHFKRGEGNFSSKLVKNIPKYYLNIIWSEKTNFVEVWGVPRIWINYLS